jgi:ribosomal protein L25 (general stress protein Ctc)
MEMQPTRASSRLRKNNSMDDLCTGIATKCKPYTLDQSKAMNKKEKACDKDYITFYIQSSCYCKHFSIGLKMSSIKRFIPVPLARSDEVEL